MSVLNFFMVLLKLSLDHFVISPVNVMEDVIVWIKCTTEDFSGHSMSETFLMLDNLEMPVMSEVAYLKRPLNLPVPENTSKVLKF